MKLEFFKHGETIGLLEIDCNLNILAHAQILNLDLGSQCGGHGVCGKDRIQLFKGALVSKITEEEKKHLSVSELAQGFRLACQCFPNSTHQTLIIRI